MEDVAITALPIVVTTVLLVVFLRRARRSAADVGAREAITAANRLPLRESMRVARAIRAGRAVDDPALATLTAERAEYAVRVGADHERRFPWFRWLQPALAVVFLVLAGVQFARGIPAWAVLSVALAAMTASQRPLMRRRWKRAAEAATANRALAAAHPDARRTGPTLDPRSTGRQRTALGWAAIVAIFTPAFYGLSRALGEPISWTLAVGTGLLVATALLIAGWYAVPRRNPSVH